MTDVLLVAHHDRLEAAALARSAANWLTTRGHRPWITAPDAEALHLPELLAERLRFVVLYHLSRTNNLPAIAAAEVAETLARAGSAAEIVISSQFEPSSWLEVGA